MKRIFLDVGANVGQTIDFVVDPQFRLDEIICFEPSPICLDQLRARYGHAARVKIVPFGLWKETCEMDLHNEGSQGGTVLADYQTTCNPVPRVTRCKFVRASDWFKDNLTEEAEIFLKMNCEGSECDIINDLLDSGEYAKVKVALIDYDVRKSPSNIHKEKELKERMTALGLTNLKNYMGPSRNLMLKKVLSGR